VSAISSLIAPESTPFGRTHLRHATSDRLHRHRCVTECGTNFVPRSADFALGRKPAAEPCSTKITPRSRRQRYSEEFKAQVVAACQGIGVSVAAVPLEHGLNANLLQRWIDQAEGRLPGGRRVAGQRRYRRRWPLWYRRWEQRIRRTRLISALRFAAEISRFRLLTDIRGSAVRRLAA